MRETGLGLFYWKKGSEREARRGRRLVDRRWEWKAARHRSIVRVRKKIVMECEEAKQKAWTLTSTTDCNDTKQEVEHQSI